MVMPLGTRTETGTVDVDGIVWRCHTFIPSSSVGEMVWKIDVLISSYVKLKMNLNHRRRHNDVGEAKVGKLQCKMCEINLGLFVQVIVIISFGNK